MRAELKTLAARPIHSNAVRLDIVSAGISCVIANSTVTTVRMRVNVELVQTVQPNHLNANEAVHASHELPFVTVNHSAPMAKTS